MLGEHQKAREPVQFTPIDFLVGSDVARDPERPIWKLFGFLLPGPCCKCFVLISLHLSSKGTRGA
jgi:hypothetical protein